MKFGLRIVTFIFCILFLFGCSEEDKVKKNYKSIVLNSENIEISNENFDKLKSIIKNEDTKTCNSSKLNDFFNSVKLKFNKDEFNLEVKDNEKNEFEITYVKPNLCSYSLIKSL